MGTYLLVVILSPLNSNDLRGGVDLVGPLGVINELLLHGSVVLEMWWLLHAPIESFRAGCKSSFTIGFTVDIFRFDSWDVATVAYRE